MTNKYLLIDGSYFIFYRVFALQMWWKNAKPAEELLNPYTTDIFKEKYIETFLLKMNEIKKKLDLNDATVIVGVEYSFIFVYMLVHSHVFM